MLLDLSVRNVTIFSQIPNSRSTHKKKQCFPKKVLKFPFCGQFSGPYPLVSLKCSLFGSMVRGSNEILLWSTNLCFYLSPGFFFTFLCSFSHFCSLRLFLTYFSFRPKISPFRTSNYGVHPTNDL